MIPNVFKSRTVAMLALGSALSITAIACGTDNGADPAAGGNGAKGDSSIPTPPPATVQSGYDAVRLALEAKGAIVVNSSEEPGGLFNAVMTNVLINGEQVAVNEFPTVAAATAATLTVSPDGTTFTSENAPPIAIDFLNRPHHFLHGNVIVVYTGADAEVITLLRDALGEEFAGDKSPVDGSPGYETVLEPAPIESIEVVEDPDNPGFFLLQVTTGLPGGCASFHDWSVEQTGELELTLTVLNRVPAPDQLIACTKIYGFAEHTIPLGSANDNLDVCEVYTVRWQNRGEDGSLRFQVTAPNVRCASPDEPIGGGDNPVVKPIIADLDALILGLRAAGLEVIRSNEQGGNLLGPLSQVLMVNGVRIDFYSFGAGDAARRVAAGVSPDGFEIDLGPNGPVSSVFWISTPHYYLSGNSIVVYVGVDTEIISALDASAGQKFAGPNSRPIEPVNDDLIPLPPALDHVLVPAPIVSVGEVVIAESFPPQYFVEITSAQPNGCDRDAGWTVDIVGNNVNVTVSNSQPADLSVVSCIAIYGETTHNVRLGAGEFQSGVNYNLTVNGKLQGTFTAQ